MVYKNTGRVYIDYCIKVIIILSQELPTILLHGLEFRNFFYSSGTYAFLTILIILIFSYNYKTDYTLNKVCAEF